MGSGSGFGCRGLFAAFFFARGRLGFAAAVFFRLLFKESPLSALGAFHK